MRKAKSNDAGSPPKESLPPPKNVDEYLARVHEPARSALNRIRATIRSVVPPEATEAMSYGVPTFKYKGPLVGYGAFSSHCSFFPMNSTLVSEFKSELRNFPTSKGTIRFWVNKPLSSALVKKMVKARLVQNEQKETLIGSGESGKPRAGISAMKRSVRVTGRQ